MGYYINEDSKGNPLRRPAFMKSDQLLADGAKPATGNEFVPDLVCVIDNGVFGAAAYIYSEDERREFASAIRPKRWFTYEHAKKLSGFEQ